MEIIGQDILLIKKTPLVKDYKSETVGFKGKQYRIYAYGDKAFAVHTENDFIKDIDAGNVQRVMITVTDDGYSLDNYVTWAKATAHRLHEAKFDAISEKNFILDEVEDHNDIIA
jgi:hypothetical protein